MTVLAAGDIASCSGSGDEKTADLIASRPGTVLALGDDAYESGSAGEFANCYDPSWGRFRDRTRPAPGNHDYRTPGAAGYFGYFGSSAGDPGRGYYAFTLGTWRIYSLNSNCDAIGGCEVGSPQERWLRGDLAANPTECILAYWHHARFSSGILHGSDPRTDALWRALQDAGADVVLTGHDHDYERFTPQDADGRPDTSGIREFVVGTGGSGLRAIGKVLPTSEVRDASTHGILQLTLRPDGYDWEFIPVPGHTFTDTGSGACTPVPNQIAGGGGTAATVYVSPSGSDAAAGTPASPWATVQYAVDTAAEGSTIRLGGGTYAGFNVHRPGLTVTADPGANVVVDGPIQVSDTHDVTLRSLVSTGATTQYLAGISIRRSSQVTITGSTVHGNSEGILLEASNNVHVEASEVFDNASGIEIHSAGDGIVIASNRIHDNGRVLDASRGGTGVNLYFTSGSVTIEDNEIFENHTADRGDGVGVEIYGSGNVTIQRNRFWGNLDVIETGTDSQHACSNLTIVRNVAYRSGSGAQHGMILRCAADSLVAHNTLVGLDLYAFDISQDTGSYGASVDGLRIINNIAADCRAFSIDSPLPSSVTIDYDLVQPAAAGADLGKYVAYVAGHGNTSNLATFTSWTGFERHGVTADPQFTDAATHDFTLRPDSPAVDAGVPIPDSAFAGSAPDLGFDELDP